MVSPNALTQPGCFCAAGLQIRPVSRRFLLGVCGSGVFGQGLFLRCPLLSLLCSRNTRSLLKASWLQLPCAFGYSCFEILITKAPAPLPIAQRRKKLNNILEEGLRAALQFNLITRGNKRIPHAEIFYLTLRCLILPSQQFLNIFQESF